MGGHEHPDVGADGLHLLGAGVVLGEDDPVGPLPGGVAHALPAVDALAAGAAEHDRQLPAGVLRLDGAQGVLEAHAVVGVVHDHRDLPVPAGIVLHAAGDKGADQALGHRLPGDIVHLRRRHGGQGVFHIEQAGGGDGQLPLVPGCAHVEGDPVPLLADIGAVHVGGGELLGEGDHTGALLRGGAHLLHVVAVQVDAGVFGLLENQQLGVEVVLQIGVLHRGDVILPDVEEHRAGQLHPDHPAVLQRLAGHLHGQVVRPGGHGVEQVLLEIQRLRRGQLGGFALHPVVGDDGGQQGALPVVLPGQPGVHDGLEVVGRGGLALGAGDAGDLQRPGGVAEGPVGQQAHGLPDVGDLDAGQGHLRVGRLADVGKGPLPHGVPQVLGLELGPLADKQGVGDHHLGVAGHQRHRAGGVGGQGGIVRHQLVAEQQLIVVPQGETGSVHLVHHLVWSGGFLPRGVGLPGRGTAFDVKSGGKTTRACGPWTRSPWRRWAV